MVKKTIYLLLISIFIITCDDSYFFDKAMENYKKEQFTEAANQFDKVFLRSSDSLLIQKSIFFGGRSNYELDNFEEALKYFNTAISYDSLNSEYHYHRSLTLWKWGLKSQFSGEFELLSTSMESIGEAIRLNVSPLYVLHRARVKRDLKDHTGAIQDLKWLISLDSSYSNQYVLFANFLVENRTYPRDSHLPIPYLNAAIQEDIKNDTLYYLRSLHGDSSLKDITKSMQLSPNNYKYYIQRARFLMEKDDFKNNEERSRRIYTSENTPPPSYTGNYQLALKDLNKAITLQPTNSEAYYLSGTVKLRLRDTTGCNDLSKAGQMGYSRAYKVIENACN